VGGLGRGDGLWDQGGGYWPGCGMRDEGMGRGLDGDGEELEQGTWMARWARSRWMMSGVQVLGREGGKGEGMGPGDKSRCVVVDVCMYVMARECENLEDPWLVEWTCEAAMRSGG